jgi:hypothetical protein
MRSRLSVSPTGSRAKIGNGVSLWRFFPSPLIQQVILNLVRISYLTWFLAHIHLKFLSPQVGMPARHQTVKYAPSPDELPTSGKVARPAIMPVSR